MPFQDRLISYVFCVRVCLCVCVSPSVRVCMCLEFVFFPMHVNICGTEVDIEWRLCSMFIPVSSSRVSLNAVCVCVSA